MSKFKSSDRIVLQVGERRFNTTVGTLTERSEYFEAYFSGKWSIDKQEDGSIFIDSDGDAFDYLLRYLRRGTFPLAFDIVKGHDYALYSRILEEAKYFQCPKLVFWLEHKCYEKCVSSSVLTALQETEDLDLSNCSSVHDMEILPCTKSDSDVYICPRGIGIHRGAPHRCGRQCANAQGDDDPTYEKDRVISRWLVARTIRSFNHDWMTDFG